MRFHPAESSQPERSGGVPKIDTSFTGAASAQRGPLLVAESPAVRWKESICDMGTRSSEMYPALMGSEKAWCLRQEWKLSGPGACSVPERETSYMSFEDGLTFLARRNRFGAFLGEPAATMRYAEKAELGRVSGSGEYFMGETQELLVGDAEVAHWIEKGEGDGSTRHSLRPAQMCSYQGWLLAREEIGPGRKHGPEESFVPLEKGIELLSRWGTLDGLFKAES